MKTIVVYKSKYGGAERYARWIAEALGCDVRDAKDTRAEDLLSYDTIVYGGGLYAEVINGVHLITKNIDKLRDKKIAVFTVGITPIDRRDYYDTFVLEKNFKTGVPENVKVFNYVGKMLMDELSVVHRAAIKSLKKLMMGKENPSEMEKLLIDLCDFDDDKCDITHIDELVNYCKE